MKKVLSQEEIDALLSNVSGQPGAERTGLKQSFDRKAIQLYDFKHPERINKDQLRTLRTIHDNFARMLATFLSTSTRSLVDVHFNTIDQVTFNEYMLSLAVPNALYTLKIESLEGKAIIEISPQFLLFIVDRMLGGVGETEIEAREITIIEQNVVNRIVNRVIDLLNEAWAQVHVLNAKVEAFETDPQFVQIARSTEALAIIFFEIRIRGAVYMMNIGLPYYVLEPILTKLSSQSMMAIAGRKVEEKKVGAISDRLRATSLPLRAILANTTMKIKDFIDLKSDDLILLEQRTSSEMQIQVGGRPKFFGTPGKLGRRKAIKLLRTITPEEEMIYE